MQIVSRNDSRKAQHLLQTKKGLCFNCFYYGHRIHQCRTPPRCDECKGKHHTLFHDPNRKANTDTKEEPATAMCSINGESILFPIAAVQVKHEDRSVATLAVLDQCSDVSLCTSSLLQRLSINGTPKPFTVNTVSGQSTDKSSVQTNLLLRTRPARRSST